MRLKLSQIKRAYRQRRQVEEALKQEFGRGGPSTRKARVQVAHLHPGLMTLCLTQQAALAQRQALYTFKHELFRQLIPNQLPLLEPFSVAA